MKDLRDGADDLKDESEDLKNGFNALAPDLQALQDESEDLKDGLEALKHESEDLGDGLEALKHESEDLGDGLEALKEDSIALPDETVKLGLSVIPQSHINSIHECNPSTNRRPHREIPVETTRRVVSTPPSSGQCRIGRIVFLNGYHRSNSPNP